MDVRHVLDEIPREQDSADEVCLLA
jgi:hypothetical protein